VTGTDRIRGVLARVVREVTIVSKADGATYEVFPVAASPVEGAALRDQGPAKRRDPDDRDGLRVRDLDALHL
jgi:hypothetical protein